MGSEGLLAAILAAIDGYWLLWMAGHVIGNTCGYWRLYWRLLVAVCGYWHPTWMDGSEGLLAATGGYRWLLVTMDSWTCYREYMWLLAAILAATGGYVWLLASYMDGWGLRGYWRL